MGTVGIVVLAVAVLTLAAAAATLAVIIGIHQEESRWTLKEGAPTGPAVFARRVLGTYAELRPDPVSELEAAGATGGGSASDAFSGR